MIFRVVIFETFREPWPALESAVISAVGGVLGTILVFVLLDRWLRDRFRVQTSLRADMRLEVFSSVMTASILSLTSLLYVVWGIVVLLAREEPVLLSLLDGVVGRAGLDLPVTPLLAQLVGGLCDLFVGGLLAWGACSMWRSARSAENGAGDPPDMP